MILIRIQIDRQGYGYDQRRMTIKLMLVHQLEVYSFGKCCYFHANLKQKHDFLCILLISICIISSSMHRIQFTRVRTVRAVIGIGRVSYGL